MILEIEDYYGNTKGAIRLTENNEDGEIEIKNIKGEYNIADIDFDDIFDTNEYKVRIQKETKPEQKDHFLTLNYETIIGVPDNCKDLIKELNSYCAVLKHYYNNNYRDVWVLIQNYFGHINYGDEFGYFKTHDEICDILLYNFFISHEPQFSNHFKNFCNRQITKIRSNLKNLGYEIDDEYIEKRISGEQEVY